MSERSEAHVLTVREIGDWFKREGVIRSERSIARWCEPDAVGKQRLDAVLEDYQYWITRESVERVLAEEREKDERFTRYGLPPVAINGQLASTDDFESPPIVTPPPNNSTHAAETPNDDMSARQVKLERLEQENRELQISNKFYDKMYFRQVDDMKSLSREIGRLEEQVKQLPPGRSSVLVETVSSEQQGKENSNDPKPSQNINSEIMTSQRL